jgi:hypothetical protein
VVVVTVDKVDVEVDVEVEVVYDVDEGVVEKVK